jgi:hypothetical protein
MMRLLFTIILSVLCLLSFGNGISPHAVQAIPSKLKEGANAVIRKDQRYLKVNSIEQAYLRVEKTVTILNEKGAHLAPVYIYYDPQRHIKQISCTIYNAQGEIIEEISPAEFGDYPAVSNAPLLEQHRFKVYSYRPSVYPYTIAYSYEVAWDGLYQFPTWNPISSEGVSVQHASFTLDVVRGVKFGYKTYNLGDNPEIQRKGKRSIYTWTTELVEAVAMEALGPDFFEITPTLLLAPERFSYEGYPGSARSWQHFGQWVYELLEGRQQLPEATIEHVRLLVADASGTREKVKLLYEYLQNNVKPLDLPLGIGSYQPFSAMQTDTLGYADSKSMSNYLLALLDAAGIKAQYALINAGKFATSLEEDLPGAQFNRAIVAVPMENDTLWLDAMQQEHPAGFLGYELSDRKVLLISNKGGKMVSIPALSAEQNRQFRTAKIKVQEDGTARAVVDTYFEGMQYSHISSLMLIPPFQQEQVIYRKTNIENFELLSFSYNQQQKQIGPQIRETLELQLDQFARTGPNSLSFVPNLMNQMDGLPPITKHREYPVVIRRSFLDRDILEYELPPHEEIRLPDDAHITSEFGEYRLKLSVQSGKLVYERTLKTCQGTYPATAYGKLMEFYESIIMADQRKVLLYGVNEREAQTESSDASSLR